GYIEAFEVEVSRDGQSWEKIHSGAFGNIRNDPGRRIVMFDTVVIARFVKLSHLAPPGGFKQVGAAEIDLLSE
ncbi:MAG: discoidin domain-containing protein, partial [Bacteroidales bacterium]|nr:discoidin domain-containing protein [Bacteroidales bacterium]